MHTAPDMTDFLVCKTGTLKEFLSLLQLLWQPTTAQLNPPHLQTRFQKSWDTVQIVNKNRMQ